MSAVIPPTKERSPAELAALLRERVSGEVLSDPYVRSLYSTDASIYEVEPVLVVYPRNESDVCACVRTGHQLGLPVIARGGGTGLAGESLGRGIILDLAVHMNQILELDKSRQQVTLQPGVVLASLNRGLARHGFRFPVDPASNSRCTLGGMIANNSSGAHTLKFGDTRRNLVAARICLSDGTLTLAQAVRLSSSAYEQKKREEGLAGKIHRELPELLHSKQAVVAQRKVEAERDRSGYAVNGVLNGEVYDLSRLICGCEGTLGIVTQAVLRVEPLAPRTGMAVVYFDSLLDSARAIPAIRTTQPTACELLGEPLLTMAREATPQSAPLLPPSAQAMLIIEYEGADEAEILGRFDALKTALAHTAHQSLRLVPDKRDQAELWATREAATPILYRRRDTLQPVSIVEDGAVPITRLAEYVDKAGRVFEKYGIQWSSYAHAGHGEVHIRPLMDLKDKKHLALMEPMVSEVHQACWDCGGTISGEHGEGLVRAQFLEKQAGTELYGLYKEIKALFDPHNLLNPGKKINDDPHVLTKNLRFGAEYRFNSYQPALNWEGQELAVETEKCNGCAQCRTTGPEKDMCPRFKYRRVEHAAPRAKANILRRMLTGRQAQGTFGDANLLKIYETCYNCRMCHSDCPSGVNIPKLVLEAKARHHSTQPLSLAKQMFIHSEILARQGMWFRPLANTLAQFPPARWLMEQIVGIDRRRPLPLLKKWEVRRRHVPAESSLRPKVVLYPDLFARYYEPELMQAAVDVLEHNGFEVYLPDVPWSNMPTLTHGAVEYGRKHIAKVAQVLAPYAFKRIPILGMDPSATLCLKTDFLFYLDTPQTRAVSRHTLELTDFLAQLLKQGKLKRKFQPVEAVFGYHQPCHHKALKIGLPALELLKLIPGITTHVISEGCCGSAGPWGLLRKNYAESMAIGANLFTALASPRRAIAYGLTECPTCKTQMEYGAGKRTLHPIQVLAVAYGYSLAEPRLEGMDRLDLPEKPKPQNVEHVYLSVNEADPSRPNPAGASDHEHAAVEVH